MSKLYFFYGCMGSAKTLNLLTSAYQLQEKNIPFLCLKPSIDTRSDKIESRVGIERECIIINSDCNIYSLITNYINAAKSVMIEDELKWIFIDECQFLTKEQVDDLAKIVDDFDINVSCYGLRTDFKTEMFNGSKRLMEIADTITEIKSLCNCGKKAIVNARINENGHVIVNGSQVLIGGNEKYVPLCRKCYRNKTLINN